MSNAGGFYVSDKEFNGDYEYRESVMLNAEALHVDNVPAMATWVDDDIITSGYGGRNITTIVEPIADKMGIPVTFGAITPISGNVGSITKLQYLKNLQRKGHQITAHPIHSHWYGSDYDITKVEPELIDCLTELNEGSFFHSNMLIYPGSSSDNPRIVEIVRKWCECGIVAGYGTPNHKGESTAWQIKRTFINFSNYYDIHHNDEGFVSSLQWYKDQVDSAYENRDWIIFGTHCYQFEASDDTSNPNANTRGNLNLLMQYVIDKGLEFRTLWDAFNRRKFYYNM